MKAYTVNLYAIVLQRTMETQSKDPSGGKKKKKKLERDKKGGFKDVSLTWSLEKNSQDLSSFIMNSLGK